MGYLIKTQGFKMKKIISILSAFLCFSAWASENCKDLAQTSVEIREDYKSYAELESELAERRALLNALGSAEAIALRGKDDLKRITGQLVFFNSGGAKGERLYKKIYNACVTDEKSKVERQAKQEARAAAKAAKESK